MDVQRRLLAYHLNYQHRELMLGRDELIVPNHLIVLKESQIINLAIPRVFDLA